jgi:ubiquinone/menaquinone biosynthesis C-methylase UbiE
MDANKDHEYQQSWEEWALIDPKWAISTRAGKSYGRWNDEEFFESGKSDVDRALREVEANKLEVHYGKALDFGCGVGRLTRALSSLFAEVAGVDASGTMISNARKIHTGRANMTFHEHQGHDLKLFNDSEFDFVFSLITLQHIPDVSIIKRYLEEFLRITKPGGIIYFGLPSVPNYPRVKEWLLRFRAGLYGFAVALGFSREGLYRTLRLKPFMYMNHLRAEEVDGLVRPRASAIVVVDSQTVFTRYLLQKK